MKLSKRDNARVRREIKRCLNGRKVPTEQVITHVFQKEGGSVPGCKRCHISGLISGMDKQKEICCAGGYCW